jgi:hypothetical protein
LAFVLRAEEAPKAKGHFVGHRKLTARHVMALLGPRHARLLALLGMRLGEYVEWQLTRQGSQTVENPRTALLFTRACPFLVWWQSPGEVFVEPVPWLGQTFRAMEKADSCPPAFDLHHLDLGDFDHHGLPRDLVPIRYQVRLSRGHTRRGRLILDPQGTMEDQPLNPAENNHRHN